MPWRAIFPEDADNPYAPPRADVGTPSMTGEFDPVDLRRKLAHLESFAKAVAIVCIIFASYESFMFVYYAGWAILAKLGAISIRWPFHTSAANIAIVLAVPVAITGLTAGYGLRHLRSWSSWTMGAYTLALFVQFAVFAYNDYQLGNQMAAATTLVMGAIPLVPVAALWRLDLDAVLSKDYGRVVADTPHIQVRAKLPLPVKCTMALLLVVVIGVVCNW